MTSNQQQTSSTLLGSKSGERGAALVMAIILLGLLAGVSLCSLAVVSNEARIAGSDLQRTQTFYAASAGIEKMTSDFSSLFTRTSNPTQAQLTAIQNAWPSELTAEGFSFSQTLTQDDVTLAAMRQSLGITNGSYPTVTIPSGPFSGLLATVTPYKLTSTVTQTKTNTQVALEREMNNYLIPLFQFGMFSDKDIELHPGPPFIFNGRIHTNGNLYLRGDVTLLDKVTTANELVYDVLRNGKIKTDVNIRMQVGSVMVPLTMGSVVNGPNLPGAVQGTRGYFPLSPNGTDNTSWKNTSVAAAQTGINNQFGGQLLTRSTGAVPLLLPLQLGGNSPRELVKRSVTGEAAIDPILSQSRYHSKAEIRILIDDEGSSGDAAGIPSGKGVALSAFVPSPLAGGKALYQVKNDKTFDNSTAIKQEQDTGTVTAHYVRRVATCSGAACKTPSSDPSFPNEYIPSGSGVTGRILIEIVPTATSANPTPTPIDVTQTILSMGVTEGEPNSIIMLQRPMWAAFTQGSRDSTGGNDYLSYITTQTTIGSDGEIKVDTASSPTKPTLDSTYGFITQIQNDDGIRKKNPPPLSDTTNFWNSIVPINVYNVREGWINSSLDETKIYERGMTNVVDINMRNLARWVDGVYDTNLLSGTQAVSTNIDGISYNGYIVYFSDRRGDRVRTEKDAANNSIQMTNGMVDNEDIYGPDGILNLGEDVQEKGVLRKFTNELPDPAGGTIWSVTTTKLDRAKAVEAWMNTSNYFRHALRLYDGDDLTTSGGANQLSQTKGITVATENMLYIWGSYNTTGIATPPGAGTATLNDGGYVGNQIPASIVGDAIFPLSKTWADSKSAFNPESSGLRKADMSATATNQETSIRAGMITGQNMSALAGTPDAGNGDESRLSGGMHNLMRFLEDWGGRRWNYVGSFCPLYYSTQAVGPYEADGIIYGAPNRNWAFDTTFRDPNRLPPGTPMFQYIESTGFRQLLQ